MVRRRWGSSPGFLGNPFGSMPRARDSGDPGATSHIGRPDAAFRLVNGVGIATSRVFGAESSRPASLLCTLRTHQSPGEWQHSLPVCLLDCDRAGLTPAGFHQEVSPSHSRFLLFQAFPSAITMSAVSSAFRAHYSMHAKECAISLSLKMCPSNQGSLAISCRSGTQSDPCISSVTRSIMITSSNSPVRRSGTPSQ